MPRPPRLLQPHPPHPPRPLQTRPGLCLSRPVPHAPALPCSPAGAGAVPVCSTRPSRRGSSPGVAPHGAPSSGQGSAGPGAGSPPLAAPAPAPAAARQEGGVEGGKLPATPTPGAGAPAATARPPATECERLRSKPAPAAASEHAQCRRGRARAPWPGAESCGGGLRTRPGLGTADVGLGEGGTSQCRGGGPGAKGQWGVGGDKKTVRGRQCQVSRVVRSLWAGKVSCFCESVFKTLKGRQGSIYSNSRVGPAHGFYPVHSSLGSLTQRANEGAWQVMQIPSEPPRTRSSGEGSKGALLQTPSAVMEEFRPTFAKFSDSSRNGREFDFFSWKTS